MALTDFLSQPIGGYSTQGNLLSFRRGEQFATPRTNLTYGQLLGSLINQGSRDRGSQAFGNLVSNLGQPQQDFVMGVPRGTTLEQGNEEQSSTGAVLSFLTNLLVGGAGS